MKKLIALFLLLPFLTIFSTDIAFAAQSQSHGTSIPQTLIWIALILIVAKLSSLIEKIGQPSVLGELGIGLIIGNLSLLGLHWFDSIKTNEFITFLAELGVIILLFQVGLESNLGEMRRVGKRSLMVAIVGVVLPFVLGTWLVGPWLLPGLTTNGYLFLGAALTATSVGITARVFKDLNKINVKEAKIVLGAAVIDDILGLIILAVVSALSTAGSISTGAVVVIFLKALAFLIGAILVGRYSASYISRAFAFINTGVGMKVTIALSFALAFSGIAALIGLAPIVGAFAAGLILDPVHFRFFMRPKFAEQVLAKSKTLDEAGRKEIEKVVEHHSEKHVEDLIEPLAHFFVPIFFVYTGLTVNLQTLFDPKIIILAFGITVVAFLGKYVSGLFAGDVNKHIVGFGMVPRGEVGLIFATIGRSLGVVSEEVFSVIVIMVILTTLLTPPILTFLLKKEENN